MTSIVGKTLNVISGAFIGSGEIIFKDTVGTQYCMFHEQDCCETVELADIVGDIEDLVGSPILSYECVNNADEPEGFDQETHLDDSATWTFYHFRTIKGSVTVRWCGSSNGYYSESVAMFDTQSNAYNGYCRPCNTKI